eukprot:377332_1
MTRIARNLILLILISGTPIIHCAQDPNPGNYNNNNNSPSSPKRHDGHFGYNHENHGSFKNLHGAQRQHNDKTDSASSEAPEPDPLLEKNNYAELPDKSVKTFQVADTMINFNGKLKAQVGTPEKVSEFSPLPPTANLVELGPGNDNSKEVTTNLLRDSPSQSGRTGSDYSNDPPTPPADPEFNLRDGNDSKIPYENTNDTELHTSFNDVLKSAYAKSLTPPDALNTGDSDKSLSSTPEDDDPPVLLYVPDDIEDDGSHAQNDAHDVYDYSINAEPEFASSSSDNEREEGQPHYTDPNDTHGNKSSDGDIKMNDVDSYRNYAKTERESQLEQKISQLIKLRAMTPIHKDIGIHYYNGDEEVGWTAAWTLAKIDLGIPPSTKMIYPRVLSMFFPISPGVYHMRWYASPSALPNSKIELVVSGVDPNSKRIYDGNKSTNLESNTETILCHMEETFQKSVELTFRIEVDDTQAAVRLHNDKNCKIIVTRK